eukprot:2161479-Pyramimonas_sp.AAC.1
MEARRGMSGEGWAAHLGRVEHDRGGPTLPLEGRDGDRGSRIDPPPPPPLPAPAPRPPPHPPP